MAHRIFIHEVEVYLDGYKTSEVYRSNLSIKGTLCKQRNREKRGHLNRDSEMSEDKKLLCPKEVIGSFV